MSWRTFLRALIAIAFFAAPAMGDTSYGFIVHNSDYDSSLDAWSKEFTLPDGTSPTGVRVKRWNGSSWDEESVGGDGAGENWEAVAREDPEGTWNVQIGRDTAAQVPYCTYLLVIVSFDTDDIGVTRGSDREYDGGGGGGGGGGNHRNIRRGVPTWGHRAVGAGFAHLPVKNYVDSCAMSGGDTGRTVAALDDLWIPPNEYAYLYQVTNKTGAGNPITSLTIENGDCFDSFLELSACLNATVSDDYLQDSINDPPGVATILSGTVSTFTGLGAAGMPANSWGLDGDDAVATFPGLGQGQSSRVLVAFSSQAPGHYAATVSDAADDYTVMIVSPSLPGDVDGDGWVSGTDLSIIISYWGQTGLGRNFGDLNGSGMVDGPDYTEVISYWGTGTAPEPPGGGAVPEPATLVFLFTGALAALIRRP